MRLSFSVTQEVRIEQKLKYSWGETAGDIPMYSLHRIRRMLQTQPIPLNPVLLRLLERHLVRANTEYQEKSGNNWSYLTTSDLISALEGLDDDIKEFTDGAVAEAQESGRAYEKIQQVLNARRALAVQIVKRWFDEHGDNLVYNTRKNIPWAIVKRLRASLALWVVGTANPFGQSIDDFVLEVAKEVGIDSENSEDAWKEMGGKIFKK